MKRGEFVSSWRCRYIAGKQGQRGGMVELGWEKGVKWGCLGLRKTAGFLSK